MPNEYILQPELTWLDGRFIENIQVVIDDRGEIACVEPASAPAARRLPGCALCPGFVNAHSHAFQRGLRGLGETYPAGRGDFWSWREAMYALVERLDADELRSLSRAAFSEMLAAGITTVGEFHYVHHQDAGRADFALDDIVLEAAQQVGIRIILLMCYYRAGGIGKPLVGGQQRFGTHRIDRFFAQVDRLRERYTAETSSAWGFGVAPHSLRAVPVADLPPLFTEAKDRGMVIHMHLEEQPREIEECLATIGARPTRWALDHLPIDGAFTAIHATHATPRDRDALLKTGANICLCPITEANLGDGIPDLDPNAAASRNLCIGSDSNIRIDFAEELRWIEYGQRLRRLQRGVHRDTLTGELAVNLFTYGTSGGARALNIPAGRIAPGNHADFFLIDRSAPSLAECTPESLMPAFLFGAGADCIREVCVGGRWTTVRPEKTTRENL